MITTTVIVAALAFVLVLTILSAFEMSLSRVSKLSVQRLIEKNRSKPAEQLKQLVDSSPGDADSGLCGHSDLHRIDRGLVDGLSAQSTGQLCPGVAGGFRHHVCSGRYFSSIDSTDFFF